MFKLALTVFAVLSLTEISYGLLCQSCSGVVGDSSEDSCALLTGPSKLTQCNFGDGGCLTYTFDRVLSSNKIVTIVSRGCAFSFDCDTALPVPKRQLNFCEVCDSISGCNDRSFV